MLWRTFSWNSTLSVLSTINRISTSLGLLESTAEPHINKIKQNSFVLLMFGSAVDSNKPRDVDILLIVDSTDKVEFHEKFLHNIASNYGLPFEERVIGFESVYEMLSKRDEKNVMNEILNKHIILYGAELFYRLIQRGRS